MDEGLSAASTVPRSGAVEASNQLETSSLDQKSGKADAILFSASAYVDDATENQKTVAPISSTEENLQKATLKKEGRAFLSSGRPSVTIKEGGIYGNEEDDRNKPEETLDGDSLVGTCGRLRFCCRRKELDEEDSLLKDEGDKHKQTIWKEVTESFFKHKTPLDPDGRFRSRWDFIILLSVLYTIIYVPFSIGWDTEFQPWISFDFIINILFIIDLVVNFHTSFVNEDGELEPSMKICAKHYLFTWFPLDLVASFPYDILIFAINQEDLPTEALKALKLFRLFRVTILARYILRLGLSVTGSLIILLLSFVLICHWFGCLFWFIAVQEGLENSWVVSQGSIIDLQDQPESVQYSTSIYWAIVTSATLGYGDITAITYVEQVFCILVNLVGALYYALIIASVQQLVTWRFSSGAEYNRWMDSVVRFSDVHKLPPGLKKKLMGYYRYVWEQRKTFDNTTVLTDLPFELRADVADFIHSKLFMNNPVFCVSSVSFRHMLACKLGPGKVKLPDDVLFFEGETVLDIVLVRRGALELIAGLDTPDELIVSSRKDGQYCGDIGIFENPPIHFVSVVVSDYSDIHYITINDFLSILENFPKEMILFQRVAEARRLAIEALLQKFKRFTYEDWRGSVRARDFTSMRNAASMFSQRNINPQTAKLSTAEADLWRVWEESVSPDADDAICKRVIKLPIPPSMIEQIYGIAPTPSVQMTAGGGPEQPTTSQSEPPFQPPSSSTPLGGGGGKPTPSSHSSSERALLQPQLSASKAAADVLLNLAVDNASLTSPSLSKRRRKFGEIAPIAPGVAVPHGAPTSSSIETLLSEMTAQLDDMENKLNRAKRNQVRKPLLQKSVSDPNTLSS